MGSIGSALNYLKTGLNPMSKMQLGYRTSKAALNMGEQQSQKHLHSFEAPNSKHVQWCVARHVVQECCIKCQN